MTINIANLPGSLRPGNGSHQDPWNISVVPVLDVLATVQKGVTVVFGPGVFTIPSSGTSVGWELPDSVSIVGESMDRTVLTFACPEGIAFTAIRHKGVTTNCNCEISRLTLVMPDSSPTTTALQVFGDQVVISHVRVLNAAGVDYEGVEAGSGLTEAFPIFGSNRVAGAGHFRPYSKSVSVSDCHVVYRSLPYAAYATAIIADAAEEGHIVNCSVLGYSHAAFSGSGCAISRCMMDRVVNGFYADTFGFKNVSMTDCLASECRVLFKSISAGGLFGAVLSNNIAYAAAQEGASYLLYLMNAKGVLAERNVFHAPTCCGVLGADLSNVVDIRLVENTIVVPECKAFAQTPDTFSVMTDFRSIGNRIRIGDELHHAYADTV